MRCIGAQPKIGVPTNVSVCAQEAYSSWDGQAPWNAGMFDRSAYTQARCESPQAGVCACHPPARYVRAHGSPAHGGGDGGMRLYA